MKWGAFRGCDELDDRFREVDVSITPGMRGGRQWLTVTNDLDAFLTALYAKIDDHVVPARRGRGRGPRLSDTEMLTLAVAQVLLGVDGEHRWIRIDYCRLATCSGYLTKPAGYHKRLKASSPLLTAAVTNLAWVSPSRCDSLRLVDAIPVPSGISQKRVGRSDLVGQRSYRYCAAHSRFYFEPKLYLLAAPDGMPIAW
jgi:hypothetical protein